MSKVKFDIGENEEVEEENNYNYKIIEVDHFEEEQKRKDKRGIFKLKREIWIQDRKDRRAQMELIAQAETDLIKIYEIMGTTKLKSIFDNTPKYLEERIKSTKLRIKNCEYHINFLTNKINSAEEELTSYSYMDNE